MKKLMMMTALAAASLLPQTAKAGGAHLNLWPLMSVEDGGVNFLWPLGRYESPWEWRFFPIIKDHEFFCVFPELWFGSRTFGLLPLVTVSDFKEGTVFPVFWWDFKGPDTWHSLLPIYYWHRGENLTTFWAGCGLSGYSRHEGKVSHWLLPLYFYNGACGDFGSLLYMKRRNNAGGANTTYLVPPLLSWYTAYDNGSDERHALLLYGHKNDSRGNSEWDFLLPFYHYDGASGDFRTLVWGRNSGDGVTWWLTPLVGTYSGRKTGGWIFPFFNCEKDVAFDRDLGYLEAETLPQEVLKTPVRSMVAGSVLLGLDNDHNVASRGEGQLNETAKRGNRLIFNHTFDRTVSFDPATGRRKGESLYSETMALCGFFYREHKANTMKGMTHTHTRVLWKLWDREETNGFVTLDAFPGFSHESTPDGSTRTSFLWRVFRHEYVPGRGTSVDLLFLPVWRP